MTSYVTPNGLTLREGTVYTIGDTTHRYHITEYIGLGPTTTGGRPLPVFRCSCGQDVHVPLGTAIWYEDAL